MGDIELLLASRQLVYSIVARAYAEEPDATFLEAIVSEQLDVALEITCSDLGIGGLQDGLQKARQCIESRDGGEPSRCIPGLRALYVRMFVGPGALPAAPWESRHVPKDKDCSQSVFLSVRNAYRRAGLLPERYHQVADDFVGLEFDFMAKLAQFALVSYQAGNMEECIDWLNQSERFLQEHLLLWIDELADDMVRHYGGSFYAFVTQFVSVFAHEDAVALSDLLSGVENE